MTKVYEQNPALDLLAKGADLEEIRAAAAGCRACDLWRTGTQTVFGEGAPDAEVMFVGEQPGDKEDQAGHPFVGPAGRVLDEALDGAGIDRTQTYVTNVVKHFKFNRRGKVRLHKKPNAEEITACRPSLEAELAVVRPRVVVCLGATAAQALIGRQVRVSVDHGQFLPWPYEPLALATIHPSAVLRVQEPADRDEQYAILVADLRRAVEVSEKEKR